MLCANNNDAGDAAFDGENARGEFENDDPRCELKLEKSCDEENGMDDEENLDDDMGADRSSGSG